MEHIKNKALKAKAATSRMACLGIEEKNVVLCSIADALRANASYILAENAKDLKAGEEKGTSKAMLDRLALSEERIEGMAQGLEKVGAAQRSGRRGRKYDTASERADDRQKNACRLAWSASSTRHART